ncbi:MAG TPA: radical SAM protein [Smithellaceae bacterium]|nr:radical SAM protein [Smithellaceae bacterium]
MKIVLMSMPDAVPIIMHESAFHLPNCGIASLAANIDEGHEIYIADLIRKRRRLRSFLKKTLLGIRPRLVGLSAMAWQYETCISIVRYVKELLPEAKIVIGGYHATLMYEEIVTAEGSESIDFIIRGEGEEPFRRLVNALDGKDDFELIPSLSYKQEGKFIHNPQGKLADLSKLKIPVRDQRRLTSGYHVITSKVEVMETSRGCTRSCSFCSMNHMYGRNFRSFPMERILADIDDIYYKRKTRTIFIADDNFVHDPQRVISICEAIIARNYRGLKLNIQADSVTIARNEEMVRKMSLAGMQTIFLGIESASKKNLAASRKGDIVEDSRKAVNLCHKYGIMVIAGLIFGFPDDDEEAIVANYEYLKSLDVDIPYCQFLTPYPRTLMRDRLLEGGMVANINDYKWYNGAWANVRTRHLDAATLQFMVWLHRRNIFGWWEPSELVKKEKGAWLKIWTHFMRPLMKLIIGKRQERLGPVECFRRDMKALADMNIFHGLTDVEGQGYPSFLVDDNT